MPKPQDYYTQYTTQGDDECEPYYVSMLTGEAAWAVPDGCVLKYIAHDHDDPENPFYFEKVCPIYNLLPSACCVS